jgi:hypothetical protein
MNARHFIKLALIAILAVSCIGTLAQASAAERRSRKDPSVSISADGLSLAAATERKSRKDPSVSIYADGQLRVAATERQPGKDPSVSISADGLSLAAATERKSRKDPSVSIYADGQLRVAATEREPGKDPSVSISADKSQFSLSADQDPGFSEWFRIGSGDIHMHRVPVRSGMTVIALDVAGETSLDVLVYNESGKLLGSDTFQGGIACGLIIMSDSPQTLFIEVQNHYRVPNGYRLWVN